MRVVGFVGSADDSDVWMSRLQSWQASFNERATQVWVDIPGNATSKLVVRFAMSSRVIPTNAFAQVSQSRRAEIVEDLFAALIGG